MLVCNCNGISERDVRLAVRRGASRWDDVHAYYGCEPCCGKCQDEIADAIRDHRTVLQPAPEPAPFFGAGALAAAT